MHAFKHIIEFFLAFLLLLDNIPISCRFECYQSKGQKIPLKKAFIYPSHYQWYRLPNHGPKQTHCPLRMCSPPATANHKLQPRSLTRNASFFFLFLSFPFFLVKIAHLNTDNRTLGMLEKGSCIAVRGT